MRSGTCGRSKLGLAALVLAGTLLARTGAAAPAPVETGGTCGTWQVIPTPRPKYNDTLIGISGTSPTDIWGVGSTDGTTPPVILHWDGTAWGTVPQQHVTNGHLSGVVAFATDDAWAEGYAGSQPLLMHWDGARWRRVSVPVPGSSFYGNGIGASSPTDVWAVGTYIDQGNNVNGYGLHWDGVAWTFYPADLPPMGGEFDAVAVLSPADAWAVGSQGTAQIGNDQPLFEHWDGTAWSIVDVPNPPGVANYLYGISPVSSNDIWAVGKTESADNHQEPLAEHYDGTGWTDGSPPNLPGTFNLLQGVVALSESDVWAVGEHFPNSFTFQPLAEHWDGTAWNPMKPPLPGLNGNLIGVTSVPGSGFWAAGGYTPVHGPVTEKPLTEQLIECEPHPSRSPGYPRR